MPKPTRKLVTDACNKQCSNWRDKLTVAAADQMEIWIQDGVPLEQIVERMNGVFDFTCTSRTLYRHVAKHMHPPDEDAEFAGMTDLGVLEQMIKQGAKNLRADSKIRISPEMTVRAIELKYKLTQGNVFEGFLSEMAKTMESDVGRGDDPAVQSLDEAAQAKEE